MSSRKVWLWFTVLAVVSFGALQSYHVASAFFPRTRCTNPRRVFRNGVARLRSRGRVVTYTCVPGFTLVGSPMATCFNQRWDRPIPFCAASGCRLPTDLRYGTVVDVENKGMVLHFQCRPGFLLSGSNTAYCDGRAWNSSPPTCAPENLNPPLSCGFEEPSLCSWTLDLQRHVQFHRVYTQKDHTFGGAATHIGHVMSATTVETVTDQGPQEARLLSPAFRSIESPGCFSMWYQLPCPGCVLRILLWETNEPQLLWTGTGPDDEWVQVQVAVPTVFQDFQVLVEGSSDDPGELSNITVDDVKLDPGSRECLPAATTEVVPRIAATEPEVTPAGTEAISEATAVSTEPSTATTSETTEDYDTSTPNPTTTTQEEPVPSETLTAIVDTTPTELPSSSEMETVDITTTASAAVSVVHFLHLTTFTPTVDTTPHPPATPRYFHTTPLATTVTSPPTTSTVKPQTATRNVTAMTQGPTRAPRTEPQTTAGRDYTSATTPGTSTSYRRPMPVVAPTSRQATGATQQTKLTTTAVTQTTTPRYFLRPRSTTRKMPPTSSTRKVPTTSKRPATAPSPSTAIPASTSSTVDRHVTTSWDQSARTEKVPEGTTMLATTKASLTSPIVHHPAATTEMPNELHPLGQYDDKLGGSTPVPEKAKILQDGGSGSFSTVATIIGVLAAVAILAAISAYAVRKVKSRNQARLSEESELAPLSRYEESDPTVA